MSVFKRLNHKQYQEHRQRYKLFWVKEETVTTLECVSKYDQDLYYESWLYPSRMSHYLFEELERNRISDKEYAEMVAKAEEAKKQPPISDRLEKAISEVIAEGKSVTYDLAQDVSVTDTVGTSQVADVVIEKLGK